MSTKSWLGKMFKDTIRLTLAVSLHLLLFASLHLQAQTEFEIKSDDANLEQEYRDELDKWMLRAYEGDRDAQFKVGVLFTNDQFDRPDFEQAVYWYKQAARQGHVLAQYNLGHQYLTGVGVAKNDQTAMQWWRQAAEQDHALAQFNVGRAYYLGIGLSEDHIQSKYWFERAAYNQEPKSIEILKQLGWYSSEIVAKPDAPAGSDLQAAVSEIGQAAPEPADSQDTNDVIDELGDRPALTSKIIPVEQTDATGTDGVIAQPINSPTEIQTADDQVAINQADTLRPQERIEPVRPVELTPDPIPKITKNPIALYTNPAVRSVLIAIIDERDTLEVLTESEDWSIVKSTVGFPVWIHSDFLKVKNNIATITGQAVNARSVPIITNGTVVGRLDQGEELAVLDKRKEWYRIIAPTSFKAWVKSEDFNRTVAQSKPVQAKANGWVAKPSAETKKPTTVSKNKPSNYDRSKFTSNDNEWLFSQSPENFTLQLASFDDPAKVKEFLKRQKFVDNPQLHRFTAIGNDIEWTYFLYGSYLSREKAEKTKIEITQKLAWVRTFGRLQQNRCVAWKKQLPTPRELNRYCT